METLTIGKNYKVFMTNHFKYEGKLLAQDDRFIKILDEKTGKEMVLPLLGMMNIEVTE